MLLNVWYAVIVCTMYNVLLVYHVFQITVKTAHLYKHHNLKDGKQYILIVATIFMIVARYFLSGLIERKVLNHF